MDTEMVATQENLREVDLALHSESQREKENLEKKLQARTGTAGKLLRLPQLLRILGATVLLAAAGTFMLQQWGILDHIARYYSFLAFTGILGVCGFFCGLKIRDDKGARTFLAIAAAIVPVHFCQLGALIYSQALDSFSQGSNIPSHFLWVAPDSVTALVTAAIGVLCLVPITLVSFSALCRSEARILTLVYLAANAVLLLPTRDPDLVGIIALGLLSLTAAFDVCYLNSRSTMQTAEGRYVRLMMAAPFVVLIGRSVHLYPTSALFFSMLFAAQAVFLFVCLPVYAKKSEFAQVAQGLSAVSAGISWVLICVELIDNLAISSAYHIPLVVLPFCLILSGMSAYAINGGAGFRKAAAVIAMGPMLVQLIAFDSPLSSFLTVSTAVVILAYGYTTEQKVVFLSGALGFLFGLVYHLKYAVEIYSFSPWISLGALGIATIVASSYVERNHSVISARLVKFRQEVRSWK